MDLSWMYSGVDHSLDGNGGPDCVNYLSVWRRVIETSAVCTVATLCMKWGYRRIGYPRVKDTHQHFDVGKQILLVAMCLTFGCEVGFKLATRTAIYWLNPCHVVSLIQIYLLASPPSRWVTAAFRCHMHWLQGAFLALAFPVLNTRLLPMEKEVYFIQHVMILVIPLYLIYIGGVYTLERPSDFSWSVLSLGISLHYHFVLLQGFGMLTEANLNNMLCPAISDPFRGTNYRVWAFCHQSLLITCFGKVYLLCSNLALGFCGHPILDPQDVPSSELQGETFSLNHLNQVSDPFSDKGDSSVAKVRRKTSHPDIAKDHFVASNFQPVNCQCPGQNKTAKQVTSTGSVENGNTANGKVSHAD